MPSCFGRDVALRGNAASVREASRSVASIDHLGLIVKSDRRMNHGTSSSPCDGRMDAG